MARSGVGKSKKRAAKMADDAGTEFAPSTSRPRSASGASADLPTRLRLLEEELEEARARIRLLEQEREQVRNRIDWVIDSLHNVIGE